MAHPGGFDPNVTPQQWRPGMGGPPPIDRSGPRPPGEGTGPPPMNHANDPAYPPIPGYEGVQYGAPKMMPPPPPPPLTGDPPIMTFQDTANLNAEDCKAAMIQFVSENCCYGSKPAKEMVITGHKGCTALHLTFETFAEGRTTKNKCVPYKGGLVDGPENGPPPPPWAIPCEPNELFNTHDIKIEVPHTSVVKPCSHCDAKGWNTCWRCHGFGDKRCHVCDGRGWRHVHGPDGHAHNESCYNCHGSGFCSCHTCGGDGRITCRKCDGYRMLRCFIQLKVAYENHFEDFILETTDMPDELVREVGGAIIFEDVQYMVWPIVSYPVPDINKHSDRFVKTHRGNWPGQKILKQRQRLRGVPVTEAQYNWDDLTNMRFWVYGNERKVYCPDYPHQCCCGCEIL